MKQTVTMPALSDTMNVGRLSRWLKRPGDRVTRGEAIAEVETDKAVMDVEAFHDGYLAGPLAPLNTDLPLGAPIANIVDSPEEAADEGDRGASAAPTATAEAPHKASLPPAPSEPPPAPTAALPAPDATAPFPSSPAGASPYARALAQDLGIDLTTVPRGGSGPVRASDVVRMARMPAPPNLEEGPPHHIERASSLRDAVARNMIASAATPTFRVTALLALAPLQSVAKKENISLTLLLARACALTINRFPVFNAAYTEDGLAQREQVDIGIAVDVPDGLITPVLHDVGRRTLAELAEDWKALRDKLKTRRLAVQDYRGATFYLSDLGFFPVVDSFDSIVPLGASAILSVAAARAEGARFTLSCDHRVIYGADGARFLTALGECLSDPTKLIAEGEGQSGLSKAPQKTLQTEERMSTNYPERHAQLKALLGQMTKTLPGPMGGFAHLHRESVAEGVLSTKVKELIALAIGVAARCEGCIAFHVHDALKAGATRAEILEALGVAIMMGGGAAEMYACDAFEALEQFEVKGGHD
jgi:pyruvate dehydrogenase E2 component (dihydrolipoamide acetyltransferase)